MKRRWFEGLVVLAVLLGLFGCTASKKKPALTKTRAPGDARLYFLDGEDTKRLDIEETITVRGPAYSGYEQAERMVSIIPSNTWVVEKQWTLEDTFDRLVFSIPQEDEFLDWELPNSYELKYPWMVYVWDEAPEEATAVRRATVEYRRNHGPLISAAPFPYAHWPSAVRDYLKFEYLQGIEDPIVKETAEEITEGCAWQLEAVVKILRWVKQNIRYECYHLLREEYEDYETGNVAWSIRNGLCGCCVDFADVHMALLRTLNIPARHVSVQRVVAREVQGVHAAVEVFFPDLGWIKFDPNLKDHFYSDAIIIGQHGNTMSSDIVDTAIAVETLSAPVQTDSITFDVEAGLPALFVFYVEINASGVYHIDVDYAGADAVPEWVEVLPDTIIGDHNDTYAICLLRKASARSQTFEISIREVPDQTMTLELEAVEPQPKCPFILNGTVDPIIGDQGQTRFTYEATLFWDMITGSAPTSTNLDLVIQRPLDGGTRTFNMDSFAWGGYAARGVKVIHNQTFTKGVVHGVDTGIYRHKFRGEVDGQTAEGETGYYAGPEVNPPLGEEGEWLDDRYEPGEQVAEAIALLDERFAVEVTGDVESPNVETTVTNTGARPLTNLIVEFSAVNLADGRQLGIYRKNLGLVLPGKSKTTAWAPTLPPNAIPGACKVQAHAYWILETAEGRSIREIGFREITYGNPSVAEPAQPWGY